MADKTILTDRRYGHELSVKQTVCFQKRTEGIGTVTEMECGRLRLQSCELLSAELTQWAAPRESMPIRYRYTGESGKSYEQNSSHHIQRQKKRELQKTGRRFQQTAAGGGLQGPGLRRRRTEDQSLPERFTF